MVDDVQYAARGRRAILLMAYGGPQRMEDVEPFLLDIRGGRPTPPTLVEEIRRRYALIGGWSPLVDITRQQAAALEAYLRQTSDLICRVYVGMRYWRPGIREAVAAMMEDGVKQVVALVMSPYYSSMSVGAAFEQLDRALRELGANIVISRVESWHNHPDLIAGLAEKTIIALENVIRQEISSAALMATRFQGKVIFTAHSLPVRILEQGDPYDAQVRETAALVADHLGLAADQSIVCYQSAGRSPEPWLGPNLEDVILELAQAGEKGVLVAPIGFLTDNLELLYDIDIGCRDLARACGVWLVRSSSLNTSPKLIAALADLASANG